MTRFYFPMGHAFIAFVAVTVYVFSFTDRAPDAPIDDKD